MDQSLYELRNNQKIIPMETILGATFGENNNTISASFKKTVFIRDYETEVVEISTTIDLQRPINNAERTLIGSLLQAQIEYQAYVQLYKKKLILHKTFMERKESLEKCITDLVSKYESLGYSANELFELIDKK